MSQFKAKPLSGVATPIIHEERATVTESFAPSAVYATGLATLCTSALLAVAGLSLKAFSRLAPQRAVSPLNYEEMLRGPALVMSAATAAKKAKKGTKERKEAKVEKAKVEKTPIVRTSQEVWKRMRTLALARVKKPTKTTGRVCYLLGKVDNRQACSVSFSHRRTKRLQKVNLHWRRLLWEEGKCFVLLRLSTKGIKTIDKYGLHHAAIKFGLDLTRHTNGTSERKYVKYLPEKERKLAMIRGAGLRYKSAVRWAKLTGNEPPPPPLPSPKAASATIAMAISHGRKLAKLGKPADQRKAMLRALTTSLIRYGRIKTTLIRAKAMRKPVDHMITLAKEGSLHSRRQALGYIYDKDLVRKLFDSAPERYGERAGGYTRIIHVALARKGDAAKMCYIELV